MWDAVDGGDSGANPDDALASAQHRIRELEAIVGNIPDVERELQTQRALATIERDVLSLLAEGAPLDVVLAALSVGLEANAPGMLASVLAIEDGRIRHVAAPSLPAAWCASIDGMQIGPRAGSCGTAAYRRERVVVADIATDPLWDDFRASALSHGLRACWSQPIISTQGEVIGTVALYYREARSPTAGHISTIEGTARVARIVLERHRDDVARDQLVNELRETLKHNEILVGILGHDLRNPLSAVVSGTQLALSRETDPQRRVVLELVAASGQRMARMISQLLDLTRVRVGGGLPLSRKGMDLERIARSVASEVQTTYPARPLVVELAGDTLGEWDADRLCQVLSNLLGNAMEHGGASPVSLRVSGADPTRVRFAVHNHGAIPDEHLASLFDPFRRGRERTQGAQGLGLGLYIARQIVLAHGGEIEVRSTPATGTTFEVSLPRAANASAA